MNSMMKSGYQRIMGICANGGPPAQRNKGRGQGGYKAKRLGGSSNPGLESIAAVESISDSDYTPGPELQQALQADIADGIALGMEHVPEQDLPRPPAPPEYEDSAHRAQARLRAEFARARQHGMPPAGHTWRAVVVPVDGLSLLVYGHRVLLPTMVREGVGIRPLRRLIAFWQRQGMQLPEDFIAWLHGREDMGRTGEALAAFGNLPSRPQEQILAQARVDQQLHLALCNALRCPVEISLAGTGAPVGGATRERCVECLEDLPGPNGELPWPGGCGHKLHRQ